MTVESIFRRLDAKTASGHKPGDGHNVYIARNYSVADLRRARQRRAG